ncbi:hypothetical protein AVEN_20051-1 [Araneus ventricosus]|uniref:Transposase Tc1-like domain-containing protein n=1 Tax=Araneus ventricosus TaxID=182803 RepID=A0A4Y2W853_ARAVE|nr:hypothetical protein AVEN_20051-1 [Araneus ventricosus]
MAGYQDLSDFERGVIVGAREMGHRISEVAMKFGFLRKTISRVYREYRVTGKTSNFRHRCGRKKDLKRTGPLTSDSILKRDRRATLPHIDADFNDGASVSVRTVQRTVINMGSHSRRPTGVPLLTARHKALLLSWARQHYHWTVDDWKHVGLSPDYADYHLIFTFSYTKYTKRKYCNRQKIRTRDFANLHVLHLPESEKHNFGIMSVCVSVNTITRKL